MNESILSCSWSSRNDWHLEQSPTERLNRQTDDTFRKFILSTGNWYSPQAIVLRFRSPITYFVKNDGSVVNAQELHNVDFGACKRYITQRWHVYVAAIQCRVVMSFRHVYWHSGWLLVIDSFTCSEIE
ncbi:hypothetical protein TNCT_203071 [Trichonephila clavata]|uniref:Uncharacterized protein n=1 Tax=Trichonephila clavata TaxID=2740835 RepID=A0A8X6FYN0_TRICU|nr:hypothetical protein TNCT_203071 [Trichonephila clavata]